MNLSVLEAAVKAVGPERVYADLPPEIRDSLQYQWELICRPNQIPPELHPDTGKPWFVALYKAGRGFGKTRVGAEWTRKTVRRYPLVNLIGATADDARDIMIEGESGILAVCPRGERPIYKKADRALEWPNGARSLIFTADEPDRLRGKQHMKVWADEIMSWRYDESWDQMVLGLRLGDCPQVVATTTPRNRAIIKALMKDIDTYVVNGSTYDNAKNLAAKFIAKIKEKYEGTRLGRQEIYAEVLDDVPGALWNRTRIDTLRIRPRRDSEGCLVLDSNGRVVFDGLPDMARIVVGVDPSGGSTDESDEQGIVACGKGVDGHGYTLDDRSCSLSPDGWGRRAVQTYLDLSADLIVGEKNYGGEMVEHVVRTAARDMGVKVNFKLVSSTRGKVVRAEPISAMHEQGRDHHVGNFPQLEDQLCAFTNAGVEAMGEPGKKKKRVSPDRADAKVFAMTELFIGEDGASFGNEQFTSPGFTFGIHPESTDDDD